MIKGKDFKQAKLVNIELDKERPLTFDFNALCELQDHYIDPFVAVNGMATGDVKCLRALLYASLLAGHLVEKENEEFDLTLNQVGRYLGQIMAADKKYYEEIFEVIIDGITLFFPQLKQEDNSKEESKEDEDSKN
ncbi:hypothetical protein [Halobacillus sp. Marseille-P3879]|uniref:hypothetical protein n=1 Tax=Halobacillus sp. Marseille-P3879 TaxID=2045014 RepID=UPI000C7BB29E|nr:hypothetical protein [Halobacillus sp. Marseille-P3879]